MNTALKNELISAAAAMKLRIDKKIEMDWKIRECPPTSKYYNPRFHLNRCMSQDTCEFYYKEDFEKYKQEFGYCHRHRMNHLVEDYFGNY